MSDRMDLAALLRLLEDDREILDRLCDLGLVDARAGWFPPEQADACRVARILVRDLEVNWPGVEVILRLRAELLETRRQVVELLTLLARRSDRG